MQRGIERGQRGSVSRPMGPNAGLDMGAAAAAEDTSPPRAPQEALRGAMHTPTGAAAGNGAGGWGCSGCVRRNRGSKGEVEAREAGGAVAFREASPRGSSAPTS